MNVKTRLIGTLISRAVLVILALLVAGIAGAAASLITR